MDYRLRGRQQAQIVFVPALVPGLRLRLPFFRFLGARLLACPKYFLCLLLCLPRVSTDIPWLANYCG
jgi:hypothetical protein